MELDRREAARLIFGFYYGGGIWSVDLENHPEAKDFIDGGFAALNSDGERYELSEKGRELLDVQIKSLSEDFIDFFSKKRLVSHINAATFSVDEAEEWFAETCMLDDKDEGGDICECICLHLKNCGYDVQKWHDNAHGSYFEATPV